MLPPWWVEHQLSEVRRWIWLAISNQTRSLIEPAALVTSFSNIGGNTFQSVEHR